MERIQILGIESKVARHFKNVYPDLITDINYDEILVVNNIAYTGISCALSAIGSSAETYTFGALENDSFPFGDGGSIDGGGGGASGGGSGGVCR